MQKLLLNILLLSSVLVLHSCSGTKYSAGEKLKHEFGVSANNSIHAATAAHVPEKNHEVPEIIAPYGDEVVFSEETIIAPANLKQVQEKVISNKNKRRVLNRKSAHTTQIATVAKETGEESTTSGLAIASMVLGILSVALFPFVAFGVVPLSILAIIFGAVSIGKIGRSEGKIKGKGMAVAGLVLGLVSFLASAILIGLLILWWGF